MSPAQPAGLPLPPDGRLPAPAPGQELPPLSAYLHVPFCTIRCGYCDFNTYTAQFGPGADRATYAQTLQQEIIWSRQVLQRSSYPDRKLRSVFFGGGTPTLLLASALGHVLGTLKENYGLEAGAEVTTEANPDSVDETYLHSLAEAGFTRVSFGMQSVVPSVLKTLDRSHDPARVPQVVEWAREAGLDVSVDLIYGTPGESLADWEASVKAAITYQPDHISAYSLIIEPGTKMHAQVKRGELPNPSDDDQATKYEMVNQLLTEAGYGWYEISNWARIENGDDPGQGLFRHASQHNLAYWRDHDWWGFGPGAHGHMRGTRWWNLKHPAAYAQRVEGGISPSAGSEVIDADARHLEQVMLAIRTREGLLLASLPERTEDGVALNQRVQELVEAGFLDAKAVRVGRLVLTLRGRLMADYVTGQLL
ncbi:radical SAM family heme chaperone HemW [Boudabousia marimammalium]|uniref:Heme chaperone HemW n=1 Tax=Boudabousia marimammalium TaxID=156892 RepID=A0A1Q5PP81_9ACTO|nr:radical SAM family heme chaperone HemW [Boudabousia marimammalium]OKL49326.1 coproporphyrinogen III oxidase [Boudabousia marimammalium]